MTGKRSRVRPHPFTADPDMPPDQLGRQTCASCHLVGAPNDAHHRTGPPAQRPLPPGLAEAARDRDAAVLGERADDD